MCSYCKVKISIVSRMWSRYCVGCKKSSRSYTKQCIVIVFKPESLKTLQKLTGLNITLLTNAGSNCARWLFSTNRWDQQIFNKLKNTHCSGCFCKLSIVRTHLNHCIVEFRGSCSQFWFGWIGLWPKYLKPLCVIILIFPFR